MFKLTVKPSYVNNIIYSAYIVPLRLWSYQEKEGRTMEIECEVLMLPSFGELYKYKYEWGNDAHESELK